MTRKNRKKRGSTITFVVEVLVLLILIAGIFAYAKVRESFENFQSSEIRNEEGALEVEEGSVEINEGVIEDKHLSGYRNIAVVGLDTRSGSLNYANSDTMIIVSINNDTQEARLLSIFRDTYLDAGGESGYNKANDAYNRGSSTQFLSMVNRNLDLAITDYIVVDFNAVATLVDELGGVTITMTADEVTHMNNYCVETSKVTGKSYQRIEPEVDGTYTLNGVQATSYARIRATAGNDFKRTARQRLVIEKITEKVKKKGVANFSKIAETVFPLVRTNLSKSEIVKLGSQMFNYNIVDTAGFPFVFTFADIGKLDCVVPVTLYENVIELHYWLFDDDDYTPSAQVREISDHITEKSGYGEDYIEKARAIAEEQNPDTGSEADGR
ncbi:MAG: LCP family protein [Lachnospiraceae bacterium]|nr:LCP family protein [Lachnospiraceae bacterium]